MESARSIRFLHRHFLAGITEKSLNAFYYACFYAKVDYYRFMDVTSSMALELVPERLKPQPVFLCIDDTLAAKFGKQFEDVSRFFDHAAHNGYSYLNGHCFVSLILCVPVWQGARSRIWSPPWVPHVEKRGVQAGAGSIHGTAGHAQPFHTENRHNPLPQLVCQEESAMRGGRVRQPGRHLLCQAGLRHLRPCTTAYGQKGQVCKTWETALHRERLHTLR